MLPNLGTGELLLLLALGLLVFGAQKVPEIARSIGKSVNSFKAGMREEVDAAPK